MSENLNTVMDGIQLSGCHWNPTAQKIVTAFVYCVIVVASLAGNAAIGIIVYKTKTMRKPINFLIVNMAMSDLLFPIFLIPRDIQLLFIDSWLIGGPLGQALCKLVIFLSDVSLIVSIQSLILIAVDRFGAVVYPLRYPPISSKRCHFFILATWIIAMAFQSPKLFAYKLVEYPGRLACELLWNDVFGESSSTGSFYVLILVVFFIIPLLLITILYVTIYVKLKSQKVPGEQSVNAGQQRQQRERNVLKMAFAIVLGFAVCWMPLSIFWFLLFFASDIFSCGSQYFIIVAFFMARANCAINPCICFIFSRNYREGVKTILRLPYIFKRVSRPSDVTRQVETIVTLNLKPLHQTEASGPGPGCSKAD